MSDQARTEFNLSQIRRKVDSRSIFTHSTHSDRLTTLYLICRTKTQSMRNLIVGGIIRWVKCLVLRWPVSQCYCKVVKLSHGLCELKPACLITHLFHNEHQYNLPHRRKGGYLPHQHTVLHFHSRGIHNHRYLQSMTKNRCRCKGRVHMNFTCFQ